jgi:hypothetical protein
MDPTTIHPIVLFLATLLVVFVLEEFLYLMCMLTQRGTHD